MKHIAISVALAAIAFLPVACTTKQEGGVPGTANSFTLKAEKSVSLNQGEKKQVDITLDRHKEFKQDIDLSVTPSADAKGVTATVDPKSVKTSDAAKATVTISAAEDAAVGEGTVTVKATPTGSGTSAPSMVDIKVKVTATKK